MINYNFLISKKMSKIITNYVVVKFLDSIIQELVSYNGTEINIEPIEKRDSHHQISTKKCLKSLQEELEKFNDLVSTILEIRDVYENRIKQSYEEIQLYYLPYDIEEFIEKYNHKIYFLLEHAIKINGSIVNNVDQVKKIINCFLSLSKEEAPKIYYSIICSNYDSNLDDKKF